MWNANRTAPGLVTFSASALARSPHLHWVFPPQIHEPVYTLMDESERNSSQRLTLEMFNMMSELMCPDVLSDKILGDHVRVIASADVLENNLPSFAKEAAIAGGLVVDWKTDYGSLKP